MAGVSIITSDEIMEITQLVFDRYYTELKRQLRKSELPEEEIERHCTEILSKVYQAIQEQGVAAMSYEMDACAIPIINEEIRKILVPLHLNGYRNRRENPIPEEDTAIGQDASVTKESEDETIQQAAEEGKKDAVQVVSNGQVQVYSENSENELNPELRMEIRRILQQEFQLEPAQVKPVVVVVNVTAPSTGEGQGTAEAVKPETTEFVRTETEETAAEMVMSEKTVSEETMPVEMVQIEPVQAVEAEQAVTQEAINASADAEPLPELDLDIEKLIHESESSAEPSDKKEKNHLWLWIPIIFLLMILLWLTVGMLMSYDIVTELDLGYEWFNETIFELF